MHRSYRFFSIDRWNVPFRRNKLPRVSWSKVWEYVKMQDMLRLAKVVSCLIIDRHMDGTNFIKLSLSISRSELDNRDLNNCTRVNGAMLCWKIFLKEISYISFWWENGGAQCAPRECLCLGEKCHRLKIYTFTRYFNWVNKFFIAQMNI